MAAVSAMKQTTPWVFTRRSLLSASALSVLLHTTLVLVVSLLVRGCSLGNPGQVGGEKFREVGLFVTEGNLDGLSDAGDSAGGGNDSVSIPPQNYAPVPTPNTDTPTTQQALPADRPITSSSPTQAPSISGLLDSSSQESSPDSENSQLPELFGQGRLRSTQGGGAASASGSPIQPTKAGGTRKTGGNGGPGETTFMNIVGVGRSFVYVIDTSSSMDGPRLRQAKSQLKASLRLLQPNQQFAVILYNEITRRLKLRRQAEQPLYFATEVNRQLAAQEIDSIISDAGTDHRPAILEALTLRPDVLYFLTDGDEPELSANDLRDIRHAAAGTTIHVIRFGDGVWNRRSDNWLQKLASQNQGEYRELAVPAN
jgi:Ca-activated chloride channel family protein